MTSDGDAQVYISDLNKRIRPVAAIVRSSDDLEPFTQLATIAVDRVRSSSHTVRRDNDFFMKSRRERRGL